MTTRTVRAAGLLPALLGGALLLSACGNVVPGSGSGGDLPVLAIGSRPSAAAGSGPAAPDDPYPLVGTLPSGPTQAPVLRYGTAAVPAGEVTRLAAALGLSGSVARHAHGVVVAASAGELRVRDGGSWSYTRTDDLCPGQRVDVDADDPMSVAVGCAVGPDTPGATATAPTDPRATAAPVLAAAGAGEQPARVDAYGDAAAVSVDPVVGGARTSGITTSVVVDARGVRSAYGVLGQPTEGPAYPLISATDALAALRMQPRPELAIACPVGARCPGVGPQRITGAELGLTSAWDGAEEVLVPAWFFAVDGSTLPVTIVAVADRYLADPAPSGGSGGATSGGSSGSAVPPGEPASPVPAPTASDLPLPVPPGGTPVSYRVTSYTPSADGTSLVLRTEGGVCTDYAGSVAETTGSVTVTITGTPNKPSDVACPAIAKVVEVTVALHAPLDGRTVVDARAGEPVPRA